MDKRISYRVVLDTETAPIDASIGGVVAENMLVYDIGYAIVDKRGHVYKTRSFVIDEIYNGETERMQSAYYAKKLPRYAEDLKNGERRLVPFALARYILLADMEEFGCTEIYAHNANFDHKALNNTARYISNGKYHYFFPRGLTICDTMKMAQSVVKYTPTYLRYCEQNNYMTKQNTPRVTAEILYRYISGDAAFKEDHTGLADVMIEKEIMAYCFRKHKRMNRVHIKL